jgi:hypothetical protein
VITTPTINQNPPWENPEEADESVKTLWSYQLSDGWVLPRTTGHCALWTQGYWKRVWLCQ